MASTESCGFGHFEDLTDTRIVHHDEQQAISTDGTNDPCPNFLLKPMFKNVKFRYMRIFDQDIPEYFISSDYGILMSATIGDFYCCFNAAFTVLKGQSWSVSCLQFNSLYLRNVIETLLPHVTNFAFIPLIYLIQNCRILSDYLQLLETWELVDDPLVQELQLFVRGFLLNHTHWTVSSTETLFEQGFPSSMDSHDIGQSGMLEDIDILDREFDLIDTSLVTAPPLTVRDITDTQVNHWEPHAQESKKPPPSTSSTNVNQGSNEIATLDCAKGMGTALIDSRQRSLHPPETFQDRKSDPLGLSVLYKPKDAPPVDICFVRGLTGRSRQTWSKNRDPELFWPQNWLPKEPDFCTAKINNFDFFSSTICSIQGPSYSLLGLKWPSLVDAIDSGETVYARLIMEKWMDSRSDWFWPERPESHDSLLRCLYRSICDDNLSVARLLLQKETPLKDSVHAGDFEMVKSLWKYGIDLNDGPSFLERPLATAILNGRLEIARFLVMQGADADLGSTRDSLFDAVLGGDLQKASRILWEPRTLVTEDTPYYRRRSVFRRLRRLFKEEHAQFYNSSQNSSAGPAFQDVGNHLKEYKPMWKLGVKAIRQLGKNRPPRNLREVLSLIAIASAMRKTINNPAQFGDYDVFLDDFDIWRVLAVNPNQIDLYDEIVFNVWGKARIIETPEPIYDLPAELKHLTSLISCLVSETLQAASLRPESHEDMDVNPSLEISSQVGENPHMEYDHTGPHIATQPPISSSSSSHVSADPTLDPQRDPPKLPSEETLLTTADTGSISNSWVAILLMAGAIFGVIIHYFLLMRSSTLHSGAAATSYASPDTVNLLNNHFMTPLTQTTCIRDFYKLPLEAMHWINSGMISTFSQLKFFMISKINSRSPEEATHLTNEMTNYARRCRLLLDERDLRKRIENMTLYLGLQTTTSEAITEQHSQSEGCSPFSNFTSPTLNQQDPQIVTSSESSAHSSPWNTAPMDILQTTVTTPQPAPQPPTTSQPASLKLQCTLCNKTCSTRTNLNRHKREKHQHHQTHRFMCRKCGKNISRKSYCTVHERTCGRRVAGI